MEEYSVKKVKELRSEYEIYKEALAAAILRQDWEVVAGARFIMESLKAQIEAFK